MLSLLIPTYNYNVQPLVLELQKQAEELDIVYEIIVCDDANDSKYLKENLKLNELKSIHYFVNPTPLGRAKNRNELVKKAKFDLVLFLDADTFPTNSNLLKNYLDFHIKDNPMVVFGGLKYQEEKPEAKKMLRWIYGRKREAIPNSVRRIDPYKTIFTSNLLIKKEILEQFPFDNSIVNYGHEDTVFFKVLKQHQITVQHIDNPVYHLGLDENSNYICKIEESLKNLKTLVELQKIDGFDVQILAVYYTLKKNRLKKLFTLFFKFSRVLLLKNLRSSRPNLIIFDIYRLGYLCSLSDLQIRE